MLARVRVFDEADVANLGGGTSEEFEKGVPRKLGLFGEDAIPYHARDEPLVKVAFGGGEDLIRRFFRRNLMEGIEKA